MQERLHIIQIAPCFVDLERETGGVSNVVRQICLLLRQKGHSVTLICSNIDLRKVVSEVRAFTSTEGIAVYVVDQRPNPLLGPQDKVLHVLSKVLQREESRQAIAHVHTCFSSLTECAMGFFTKHHVRFIFSPHGKLSENALGKRKWAKLLWWYLIARRKIASAEVIGVLAKSEAALFRGLLLHNAVKVIPNGFQASPPVSCSSEPLPEKYILFLGFIDPRKQPDFLVRAFALSRTSYTHKLLLVGPDAYAFSDEVRGNAAELGIEGKVIFFGSAYGALKWRILRGASCLCLPSIGEGHPIVMCEALGAGIPSVYSTFCNFPEVAEAGAGVELSNFSPQAWASAIDRVVLDDAINIKMSNAARCISSRYTWEAAVDRWESLYFECLTVT